MDESVDCPGYMEHVGTNAGESFSFFSSKSNKTWNNPVPGHTEEEEEYEDYSKSRPSLSNINKPPGCARLLQQQPEQVIEVEGPSEGISVDDGESSKDEQRNKDEVKVQDENIPMSYLQLVDFFYYLRLKCSV